MLTAEPVPSSLMSNKDLRRIVPAPAKRITAENSPNTLCHAAYGPILFDRLDHVVTARWVKPALAAHNRTERDLIQAYAADDGH
jgi:hypothetical protein